MQDKPQPSVHTADATLTDADAELHSQLAEKKAIRQPLLRALVLGCGWLSVLLGVLGIFLPLLPTTPFLLLAAACFLRTSPRFYLWLIRHPKLGRYVIYYLDGKGIPLRAKIYTLLLMWSTMLLTAFVLVDRLPVKIILPAIGALVSIYILRQPTLVLSDTHPHSDPHSEQQR
ncbi:MAG: hypothetical protein CMI06_05515 [Oceanospirillaceae bacterium]|nr:hypothetical protein [Oceanospirillaceae bacterium]